MQGNTLENRMAFKKLHSIESIVRAMRDTGPFGGASIDSISIPAIIKKADEQADRSVRKLVGGVGFQNMCKVMKVFFEDKYEKSNKILVEEIISEVLQIPDNVNGFEYLCHPYLEKEENLIKYFKSWHSTTLMSTYHLLENSPLSVYFLNPSGMEEREVANELRRKYNLVVECQEINIHLSNDAPKPDSSLDVLIKTRHYVKNLLFKLKISNLRNYSKIIEDLKVVKKEPNAVSHKRNRFFSEDLPENAIVSRRLYVQDLSGPGGRQSTEDSNVNSSELSGSFQSSNRPFRIQESLLEERAEITKRRMLSGGDQSFSVMFRKDSCRDDNLEYILNQIENETECKKPKVGKIAKSISQNSVYQSNELLQLQAGKGEFKNIGLANIGTNASIETSYAGEVFEMDEDDRMIAIFSAVEESRAKLKAPHEPLLEEQKPVQGTPFIPAKFVINLSSTRSPSISEYLSIGEWLNDLKKP